VSVARTLRTAADIAEAGLARRESLSELERVAARYAVAITPAMAELIDPRDRHDPIARQFVPDPRELDRLPSERADPIGDAAHEATPGLVHRYPDRVLLKLSNVCAVYCRFCFRREMVGPGQAAHLADSEIDAALRYVAAHPAIWEVIVSGGDPLVLSPRRLAAVSRRIAAIPHVKVLRWHSRVPLVAPERVTASLVDALRADGLTTWLALHANHPDEFTSAGCAALARIAGAGIPMVSQTVLLQGVNDDAETLSSLMRLFVENRVKPYYLHHGDLAPGTSHFRTGLSEGRALVGELRAALSGLCQPTYVLDLPGGFGKVPIAATHAEQESNGRWRIEDSRGVVHDYPPRDDS
jgi:lysine 2,3-aminomutase